MPDTNAYETLPLLQLALAYHRGTRSAVEIAEWAMIRHLEALDEGGRAAIRAEAMRESMNAHAAAKRAADYVLQALPIIQTAY